MADLVALPLHVLHPLLATSTPVNWLTGWKFTGSFTTVDLVAASTNALNGALLARRPDHYKNFTIVGVLCMALLMGLGGGITRDVMVGQLPAAITNPAYLSLPWYAIAGADKGIEVGLPVFGTVSLAVVGPTAGHWYADVTSGVPPNGSRPRLRRPPHAFHGVRLGPDRQLRRDGIPEPKVVERRR